MENCMRNSEYTCVWECDCFVGNFKFKWNLLSMTYVRRLTSIYVARVKV